MPRPKKNLLAKNTLHSWVTTALSSNSETDKLKTAAGSFRWHMHAAKVETWEQRAFSAICHLGPSWLPSSQRQWASQWHRKPDFSAGYMGWATSWTGRSGWPGRRQAKAGCLICPVAHALSGSRCKCLSSRSVRGKGKSKAPLQSGGPRSRHGLKPFSGNIDSPEARTHRWN